MKAKSSEQPVLSGWYLMNRLVNVVDSGGVITENYQSKYARFFEDTKLVPRLAFGVKFSRM